MYLFVQTLLGRTDYISVHMVWVFENNKAQTTFLVMCAKHKVWLKHQMWPGWSNWTNSVHLWNSVGWERLIHFLHGLTVSVVISNLVNSILSWANLKYIICQAWGSCHLCHRCLASPMLERCSFICIRPHGVIEYWWRNFVKIIS